MTTMLTKTWQRRLDTGGRRLRGFGLAVGLTACSVVAVSTIWGWLFSSPIDVATPARSAVNRTALIGSYAQDCIGKWLTATQATQDVLRECWTLRDPMKLPTTAAVVVDSAAVSAATLVQDAGDRQQWSVVVAVSEKPYPSAATRTRYYRLPVLWTKYGVRAQTLPAQVNGPGAGADSQLGYPTSLAATSPVYEVITGFVTSYLGNEGGLERYVTTDSGLGALGGYRNITVTKVSATRAVNDSATPQDGTTVRVLASVSAATSQYKPVQFSYPLTLTVASGRWSVAAVDYAPLLVPNGELAPIIPGPTSGRR